jgi:hypothetical protein
LGVVGVTVLKMGSRKEYKVMVGEKFEKHARVLWEGDAYSKITESAFITSQTENVDGILC